MRRFRLFLAIVGSVSLFRCGGASGRPTLPPPEYEEPPEATPSATAPLPTQDGLVDGRSAADGSVGGRSAADAGTDAS